ncbi:MAG TPA: methionyl-tRNA formyltransferase [Aestuariivirgaceae bacterium]
MSLKLVFMGTPEFALPTLSALTDAGYEILSVFTRPARQAGRGMHERASPVHRFALGAGLPVETPDTLRSSESLDKLSKLKADAAVVVAYGLILPKAVLDAPKLGSYNLHASLLPRWRGPAPINRAIMAGDRHTGVTIMRMTEGLDEGPVCLARKLAIGAGETAGELHDRLAEEGAALMLEALLRLSRGTLEQTPQQGVPTYAAKIAKSETRIDFSKPAREVLPQIHGLSPHPGAWTEVNIAGKSQRLKILKAEAVEGRGPPSTIIDDDFAVACADGAVRPLLIQREGKAAMARDAFLRGSALRTGDRLR